MRKLLACALALLSLSAHPAWALGSEYFVGYLYVYERSERYQSVLGGSVTYLRPAGHDSFEIPDDALLVEGVLTQESLRHVVRLVTERRISKVYLSSPGGDLRAGIALGQLLRKIDALAVVPRRGQCQSACALAFLGAPARVVLADAAGLGFHRQYRIRDSKIVYGNPREDVQLIQSYLNSISFDGLDAEAIVATTGLATFSRSVLEERGIVTLSQSELRERARSLVTASGFTPFELISAVCARYDALTLQNASQELMLLVMSCSGRVPALREPLLTIAWDPWPASLKQEEGLVSHPSALKALRSNDIRVIDAYNREIDGGAGLYQSYVDKRTQVRKRQEAR